MEKKEQMTMNGKTEEIPAEIMDMISGGESWKDGFRCDKCNQCFRSLYEVASHIESVHRNESNKA